MNQATETKLDLDAAQNVSQKTVRTAVGRVVSAKMDKTRVVLIERKVPHPKYKKYIKRISSRFAHDEMNQAKEGDWVLIKECRPLSRHKSWTLVKILEPAANSLA